MGSQAAPDAVHVACRGVTKSFGSTHALRGADLRVTAGRISALVGENGAGKSTLMHVVAGDLTADSGIVDVTTQVGLVRQQLSTVAELTLLENVVFGAERRVASRHPLVRLLGGIDWRAHRAAVTELMEQVGIAVPLDRAAAAAPVGVRQRVDILAALYRGARCLLLDEPTTYLTPNEVDGLFAVTRDLVASGMSVVFISHRLREVAQHCDDVTVLRAGESVLRLASRPFDLAAVGRAMTGGSAGGPAAAPGRPPRPVAPPLLMAGAQLEVHAGEIVGIAGISGNGQGELLDAIAGLRSDPRYQPVVLDGTDVTAQPAARRRAAGLRYIPESVHEAGTAVAASITDNLLTPIPAARFRGPFGVLRRRAAQDWAGEVVTAARIVTRSPRERAGDLSGGNLQRLAVARELAGEPQVLLAHEPTRGVDFAGVTSIQGQIREFAAAGGAVLLVTSDLDELLTLGDRIHVIDRGYLGPSHDRGALDSGRLGELLGGLTDDDPTVAVGR